MSERLCQSKNCGGLRDDGASKGGRRLGDENGRHVAGLLLQVRLDARDLKCAAPEVAGDLVDVLAALQEPFWDPVLLLGRQFALLGLRVLPVRPSSRVGRRRAVLRNLAGRGAGERASGAPAN